MICPEDHYQTLQVSPQASQEEIEQAYHLLARRYHPDVNPSPEAHEQMVRLNQAYRTLKDSQQRRRYDALRRVCHILEREAPLTGPSSRKRPHPRAVALLTVDQTMRWRQALAAAMETWQYRVRTFYIRVQNYRWEQTLARSETITDLLFSRKRIFRGKAYLLVRLHLSPLVLREDVQAFLQELETTDTVKGVYLTPGRFLPGAQSLAAANYLPLIDGVAWHKQYERSRYRPA